MRARAMLGSAVFDPEQLKKVGKAFDDAWEVVVPQVSKRSEVIEAARLKLAEIIIGLARNDTMDAQTMAEAAAQMMLADPLNFNLYSKN